MAEKVTYRKLATDDCLVNLMDELGYHHDRKSIAINTDEVHRRGGEVFVAEVHGEICGCVCAILDARLAAGLCGEIVSLIVAEKFRGGGIGRGLIAYAEEWFRKKVHIIRVRANVQRLEAHAFYHSMGYGEEKEQKIFTKKIT